MCDYYLGAFLFGVYCLYKYGISYYRVFNQIYGVPMQCIMLDDVPFLVVVLIMLLVFCCGVCCFAVVVVLLLCFCCFTVVVIFLVC